MGNDLCPNCNFNLDGGDVFDKLSCLAQYKNKTEEEITGIAELYGWSKGKPIRFSKKLVQYDLFDPGNLFFQCPRCGCYID